ncbi:MAG: GNAT family N-acetyltransferase [Bryobacteraceae bacterium]
MSGANSDLRLRRGTLADLAIVMHHRLEMFREMGSTDAQLQAMEASSWPHFRERLADGRYQAWFIEDATGHAAAGVGLSLIEYVPGPRDPQPRRPLVVNVYTEPEYRRRGLARLLMDELIGWCRAQGFPSVVLHASDDGRRLYESLGFIPTNEMRLRFD